MTPSPDWDALARAAAGETEAGERARVRAWLNANPADRALVEALSAPIADPVARQVDVEAALVRVHQHMNDTRTPAHTGHQRHTSTLPRPGSPATPVVRSTQVSGRARKISGGWSRSRTFTSC